MPAWGAGEIDFDGRREPAQIKVRSARHDESGFGKIVLGGDGLHHRIWQPLFQQATPAGFPPNSLLEKASTSK